MNVLILTPTRAASSVLQRVLTIHMLRKGYDKPIINTNELTSGINTYFNETLQQVVMGKDHPWHYEQSLPDVLDMVKSVDHYHVARVNYWHLARRNDSITDHARFADYLNKNFYVIRCHQRNLFEYALSWVLRGHTDEPNCHDPVHKVMRFEHIYQNGGVTASKDEIWSKLNEYKEYLNWTNKFFNVQAEFEHAQAADLETYIHNLDFMQGYTDTFEDMFGIDYHTYNKVHKALADVRLKAEPADGVDTTLTLSLSQQDWDNIRGESWPEKPTLTAEHSGLPATIQQEIKDMAGLKTFKIQPEIVKYIMDNHKKYKDAEEQIRTLRDNGFIPTPVQVKLQTFEEKKALIKNLDQAIEWYNQWVEKNGFGEKYEDYEAAANATSAAEEIYWNDFSGYLTHQES